MKKPLEGRNIGFYLLLAAALAALAGAILYLVLDGEDRTFALPAFILALAGAVSTALAVFTRLKFAPLLPTALYAASAALVLRVALAAVLSGTLGLGSVGIWWAWQVGWIIGTGISLWFCRHHAVGGRLEPAALPGIN